MRLAKEVHDKGVEFSIDELDQHFQTLLGDLVQTGLCTKGEDSPPIVTKEQWLQAQLVTIQKLSRGGKL